MTRVLTADEVLKTEADHGEGPIWHVADRRLDWTDIKAGRLHRFDPASGVDEVFEIGSALGSFAARQQGGYVLAVEEGFAFFDPDNGSYELVAPVDYGAGPEFRMNDGKVDPQGRFWAGSMAKNVAAGAGALYRLDPDLSVTKVLDGVTISNGLDWSEDGTTLYYIDSLSGRSVMEASEVGIEAFDFDGSTGSISNRRRIVSFPNERAGPTWMSIPDGMTLDEQGCMWVAVPGSGQVRRYSPEGKLDTIVELPVVCPTSVAFGGEDLGDLYITTMTLETMVPPEYRRHEAFSHPRPSEGSLFRCRPGVRGRPPRMFAG